MAVTPDQQQPPPRLRVHIHETTLVPPSPSPPETSLPLTFFDVFYVISPPVERLFLYRLAPDADVAAIISNLRDSLSQALGAFFPLAGRVRLTPGGTSHRYELHYRPGDAVPFTVAGCDNDDFDLDSLTTDEPREVAKIATLVPPLPEGGRLLAVQATLLPSRRGLAIGVTVHHAACDGSGSTHFLHTWAAAAAGGGPPPPPVIDRTLVPDPRRLYDVFVQGAPSSQELESESVKLPADQLLATFVLSKDDLNRIKDAVADEATRRDVAPPRCSSLVATLGFVWSCYHRANNAGEGPPPPVTCMAFAVDHRSRMKPPLPDKYLGNCVGPAFALAPTAGLAAEADLAGGLFTACAAVASAIDEAVRDIGTTAMGVWMDRVREVLPMGLLTVSGSPRFRVYEMDFGFGRPVKVDIVPVTRTGAVAVAESRRGDGGIEVGVSLQLAAMGSYNKCFADAVAWLHQKKI